MPLPSPFLIAVAVCLAAALPAQKPAANAAGNAYVDRLWVKLAEGTGAELRSGALVSRTGRALGAVPALFAQAAAAPLVTALSWDELDRWHANACRVLPAWNRPGHLGLWFRLQAPSAVAAGELAAALAASPAVAEVLYEPIFAPSGAAAAPPPGDGDPAPPTPSFTALQGAMGPPPLGMHATRAHGIHGARGGGVLVAIVEEDWVVGHEDVGKATASRCVGVLPPLGSAGADHGIASASLIAADRNCFGLTGTADEADLRFAADHANGGIPNAMMLAAAAIQPGDVILFVQQWLFAQVGPDDWIPTEFLQPVFDAVLTATANGRIVVASAANGGRSLDDPRLLRRFDRTFRDSGAIMVAATESGQMQRALFANWGSRVDANGWGGNVVAAGYGTLFFPNNDPLQAYTGSYSGTSAAVPMVAGIVAAVQGAARSYLGRSLSTAEILNLLHTHGTPSPDVIGRRPDLFAMLATLGAVDGLEVGSPDVAAGGSTAVEMRGPAASAALLVVSFGSGSTNVGLNRPLRLAPPVQTIGLFPMPAGAASWTLSVPNVAGLSGLGLYVQAARLQGAQPIHVTNSCQVTIL